MKLHNHLTSIAPARRVVATRTGILIGSAYVAPPRASIDAFKLQSALLDPLTAAPLPLRTRIYRAVARWL